MARWPGRSSAWAFLMQRRHTFGFLLTGLRRYANDVGVDGHQRAGSLKSEITLQMVGIRYGGSTLAG